MSSLGRRRRRHLLAGHQRREEGRRAPLGVERRAVRRQVLDVRPPIPLVLRAQRDARGGAEHVPGAHAVPSLERVERGAKPKGDPVPPWRSVPVGLRDGRRDGIDVTGDELARVDHALGDVVGDQLRDHRRVDALHHLHLLACGRARGLRAAARELRCGISLCPPPPRCNSTRERCLVLSGSPIQIWRRSQGIRHRPGVCRAEGERACTIRRRRACYNFQGLWRTSQIGNCPASRQQLAARGQLRV